MEPQQKTFYNRLFITILRVAIGWHFLYEGLSKILQGNWTASGFLLNTSGFFSGFYHWVASSPAILHASDFLNMYGLLLIGLALFIGLFSRIASLCGALLLTLYYFAYPPFGSPLMNASEGHLFIVDKLFIEAAALIFLFFYPEKGFSLDTLLEIFRQRKKAVIPEPEGSSSRREVLKNLATLPVLGAMGWGAVSNIKTYGVDVMSGATIQVKQMSLNELKGELPKGKIGKHEISRLIAGGNLIGGWAHSRDLIYVSTLFKAYNTEQKVYETLMLGEQAGINTINIGFASNPLLAKYKKMTGSKIKVITQVAPNLNNKELSKVGPGTDKKLFFENIDKAIDFGVDIIQVQGNWCDWLVRDNKLEVIHEMLEHIRQQGYTAGLGAHSVESLIACADQGIIPDYYMKTMHHDQYWSAHPRENRFPFEVDGKEYLDHNRFHNNMFCLFPERTVEFVSKAKVPVMGFKVLAAGAIEPKDGFQWAYDNGADFICVGMFDFQVVSNVNTAINCLNKTNRTREWVG
ncbi:MAG: DoxX family protein [Prolixibacteraceae bacterium]|nr:DoxX family protein [Prolixibacteraceae bacterium]